MTEEARDISNLKNININKPQISRKIKLGDFDYQNLLVKSKHVI